MYMYFKHVKLDTCADFLNIWGVPHSYYKYKFMYIFNYSSISYIVTSVVFADVGIGILIIHHRYTILYYIYNYILFVTI